VFRGKKRCIIETTFYVRSYFESSTVNPNKHRSLALLFGAVVVITAVFTYQQEAASEAMMEKFRSEDESNKQKIEAKNGLENYCFTMRNTLNEEKLKDKFEGGDKEKIEKAVQDTLDWLDKNQLAEKDEFEAKQKELEGIVNPIMMKVYQAAGGGGMPEGGMPGGGMGGGAPGGGAGPTVEEVD